MVAANRPVAAYFSACIKAACEIARAHGVDFAVVTLDAADRILRQFDGRDFLCRKSCR